MMDEPANVSPIGPEHPRGSRRLWRVLLNICISILVVSAGIAGAAYLNQTAPKPKKRKPAVTVPLVRTQVVVRGPQQVVVSAMGTVIPARQISLKPRVAGELVDVHPDFIEGGHLNKGMKILKIDPADYSLAVIRKKSALTEAEYALKVESGYQTVARREWELLNGDTPADAFDAELALRKPHLAKAEADLASAKADLKQARLNLSRTQICAPFNAVVKTKAVDIGSQVSTQDTLAELVGTDEYWVQVSIPVERLKWIRVPREAGAPGARAQIRYGNGPEGGYEQTGEVIKLLPDLESEGRMARLLVSVKDPLFLRAPETRQPPMLIGESVRVKLEGIGLDDVLKIPRSALRDNASIWVADPSGILTIRAVETVWRDKDTVLLRDGLQPGERIIVSDLSTAVDGMAVRLQKTGNVPGILQKDPIASPDIDSNQSPGRIVRRKMPTNEKNSQS